MTAGINGGKAQTEKKISACPRTDRCSLPCDPPVGGHSCNGGMIPRFHRAEILGAAHEPRRQRLYGAFSVDCREVFAKRGLGMMKKIGSYPELADPQLQPRYSGIPTFFRLPHSVRLDEVDIGLVGVPFDGGVTNRSGARHGPRDIRNQSSLIRKINKRPAWRPSTSSASPIWETPGSNGPSSCRGRSPKSPPSSLPFMRLA